MSGRLFYSLVSMLLIVLASFSVMLISSMDSGGSIAFEKDRLINQDLEGSDQTAPDIVASGNDLYIFWQDVRSGNWDIYSRASHDGGLNFGPEVRVDDTSRTPTYADDVSNQLSPRAGIAPDGTIHVVWGDDREGRSLIFHATSTDRGATFSSNSLVADHFTGAQSNPDLDISPGGNIAVVWEDTRDKISYPQIYGTFDTGSGFSTSVKISDVSSSYRCIGPVVTTPEDDRVHVAWSDDRVWDEDIYLASSFDAGSSFDASIRISRDPTGSDQNEPDIAANSTHLYIVWKDPRSNSADIYMAVSTDDGSTFTLDTCIHPNQTSGHQFEPRLEMDEDGNVTFGWTSSPGMSDYRSDIQMTRLYTNGSFDRVYTVNEPLQGFTQDHPALALGTNGMTYFVWKDTRRSDGTDIYFSRTTQSGETGFGPELADGQVNPEIGGVGDRFDFKVTYSDIENDPPGVGHPKLNLFYLTLGGAMFPYPGSPFNMTLRLMPAPDYDYRNGETYIQSVEVTRDLDLFYYFSTKASAGNLSEVRTEIMNLPKIDDQGPSFELLSPAEGEWIDENIIDFELRITDDLSGVDPWSTFYQAYQEEKGEWDRWQRKGTIVNIDNHTALYSVSVIFLEGQNNKIRFRAKDMLGNGGEDEEYSISETYSVWVDATGPFVQVTSPRSGSVFHDTIVEFEATIYDSGTGVDLDNIEISYSLNGVADFGPWQNLSAVMGTYEVGEEGIDVRFNISLSWGFYNFVRVRAKDKLGNIGQSSNIQVIIREKEEVVSDRPPSMVASIQPKISGSVRPHITWSPSFDPDGDMVSYNISVFDQTGGVSIVENEMIALGDTYWDPEIDQLFTPGHIYVIEITPYANGKMGPTANSTLLISTDANYPPDQVMDFEPKATSIRSPVLSWTPAEDPDGDEVYYFIRIGRYYGGSDVLPWTSVFTETRYAVAKTLQEGVYYIDILASDGKDFAPISHFSMSIGIYNPILKVQRSQIVVYQDSGQTINLTISNRGFTFDNIKLRVDGEALQVSDLEITLGTNQVEVAPGSSMNTTFHVDASKDAVPGLYSLNITITSLDGISSYTKPLSVRVVDPANIPGLPSGNKNGDDDTDVQLLMVLFVIILFAIIVAMGYAYYRLDRRDREETVRIIEKQRKHIADGKKGKKELRGKSGKKALPPKKKT